MDWIDIGLYAAYILTGLAILASVLFPVIYAFRNPKESLKSVAGIVALGLIFGIAYALASDTPVATNSDYVLTPTQLKLIGAGLITFYILTGLAVLSLVFSLISNIFK